MTPAPPLLIAEAQRAVYDAIRETKTRPSDRVDDLLREIDESGPLRIENDCERAAHNKASSGTSNEDTVAMMAPATRAMSSKQHGRPPPHAAVMICPRVIEREKLIDLVVGGDAGRDQAQPQLLNVEPIPQRRRRTAGVPSVGRLGGLTSNSSAQ